jgi:hypothetical protein
MRSLWNRAHISSVTEFADSGNPDIEDAVLLADFLANAIHAPSRSFDSHRVSYALDGVFDRHLHLDRDFRGIRLFSTVFLKFIVNGDSEGSRVFGSAAEELRRASTKE